jgi:hypothetical protein
VEYELAVGCVSLIVCSIHPASRPGGRAFAIRKLLIAAACDTCRPIIHVSCHKPGIGAYTGMLHAAVGRRHRGGWLMSDRALAAVHAPPVRCRPRAPRARRTDRNHILQSAILLGRARARRRRAPAVRCVHTSLMALRCRAAAAAYDTYTRTTVCPHAPHILPPVYICAPPPGSGHTHLEQ